MKKRNLFSLLLALFLILGARQTAGAAVRPELRWENSRQEGEIYLDLLNLDGGVYGVQLELTLDGSYPNCVFEPDSKTAYSPACTAAVRQGKTDVVIYITDTEPLNDGEDVTLGTLDLKVKGTIDSKVLPEKADLTILDRGLAADSMSVYVTETGRRPSQSDTGSRPVTNPTTPTGPASPEPVLPGGNPGNISGFLPFVDVNTTDWFYNAVQYVYSKGMMNGTDPATFAPDVTTTRGMIVTILHRLEGSPAALPAAFTDVPAGQYYTGPVAWASANGIVTGVSSMVFQPDSPITREQMTAILYRYAQYKKVDVSRRNNLLQFSDRAAVSPYAVDAVSWVVDAGLINGIDGRLEPAGYANRAQVATILMRLCENVVR